MRTRETVLAGALAALALILAFTPAALGQEEEPTLNESEMDASAPPADESYLDEAEEESSAAEEPTLAQSDMDTQAPAYDESYLDEAERELSGADQGAATTQGTPGPAFLALVAAVGVAALVVRTARR